MRIFLISSSVTVATSLTSWLTSRHLPSSAIWAAGVDAGPRLAVAKRWTLGSRRGRFAHPVCAQHASGCERPHSKGLGAGIHGSCVRHDAFTRALNRVENQRGRVEGQSNESNVPQSVEDLTRTLEDRAQRIRDQLIDTYGHEPVREFLAQFDRLHAEHVKAVREGFFLRALELVGQIHRLSYGKGISKTGEREFIDYEKRSGVMYCLSAAAAAPLLGSAQQVIRVQQVYLFQFYVPEFQGDVHNGEQHSPARYSLHALARLVLFRAPNQWYFDAFPEHPERRILMDVAGAIADGRCSAWRSRRDRVSCGSKRWSNNVHVRVAALVVSTNEGGLGGNDDFAFGG